MLKNRIMIGAARCKKASAIVPVAGVSALAAESGRGGCEAGDQLCQCYRHGERHDDGGQSSPSRRCTPTHEDRWRGQEHGFSLVDLGHDHVDEREEETSFSEATATGTLATSGNVADELITGAVDVGQHQGHHRWRCRVRRDLRQRDFHWQGQAQERSWGSFHHRRDVTSCSCFKIRKRRGSPTGEPLFSRHSTRTSRVHVLPLRWHPEPPLASSGSELDLRRGQLLGSLGECPDRRGPTKKVGLEPRHQGTTELDVARRHALVGLRRITTEHLVDQDVGERAGSRPRR